MFNLYLKKNGRLTLLPEKKHKGKIKLNTCKGYEESFLWP